MRPKRTRKSDLVILGILFFVVVVFQQWIKPGPWFLPSAFSIVFGVIAVFIVAFRAHTRLNNVQRDPSARPCSICKYDLRGNMSGRCPECGTRIAWSAGL